ncbi:DUF3426 domain-containing protein [Wenzhouxiangella sp. XN201]|uniref:DUF3426 domain-containing protein n=1 Tax=Wenzhouxiangella sp. XN201 TaxID=2710755 RepID=UPI0013C70258|nr:DUF3426 domain-containing protein [Wenzhouxiangella sp. XN201]NEZ04854.1 DUF3426 domain-containing protein [Wenzhouxiangella sp. XN201]
MTAEQAGMFTRCPGCQAVYELRARLLAEAAGVVRCGSCGKTFNSLSELFEHRPDQSDEALRGEGMPPLLEHVELRQAELPVAFEPVPDEIETDDLFTEPTPPGGDSIVRRHFWPALSAVLLVLLLIQLWALWQTPGSPIARWLGSSVQPDAALDPNQTVQIVSRDMHPHPSLDDAVIVSTSLRNQAETAIPFPVIEFRFYDASQQVLGVRRVTPEEYIQDREALERGLAAGRIMPLVLEFVIGTSDPAGFQMRFH